jgi:hypothetical protein
MIPEAKKTAVAHAMQTAFGVSTWDEIYPITVGLSSALVFRIVVHRKPYLLKIITRTDAIVEPTYQFNCTRAGASAGIAPQVRYMNAEDRISITDYVESRPFPLSEARVKLPLLLSRLHGLPPFGFRLNYFDVADGFVRKFKEAQLLPEEMTSELFSRYADLTSVYPRHGRDWVASHNDLKPENMLYDGNQPWMVDWEAAFLNDRYLDLSMVANFVVTNEEEEMAYLKSYFGKEATEYQKAQFFLMRQITHMAYFTFIMRMCSIDGKPIDLNFVKPDFRTFHDDMWAGKINLATTDAKLKYSWVHMQQLLHNVRLKRFEEALMLISSSNWSE